MLAFIPDRFCTKITKYTCQNWHLNKLFWDEWVKHMSIYSFYVKKIAFEMSSTTISHHMVDEDIAISVLWKISIECQFYPLNAQSINTVSKRGKNSYCTNNKEKRKALYPGINLRVGTANERRRFLETPSLIGCAHPQIYPCYLYIQLAVFHIQRIFHARKELNWS